LRCLCQSARQQPCFTVCVKGVSGPRNQKRPRLLSKLVDRGVTSQVKRASLAHGVCLHGGSACLATPADRHAAPQSLAPIRNVIDRIKELDRFKAGGREAPERPILLLLSRMPKPREYVSRFWDRCSLYAELLIPAWPVHGDQRPRTRAVRAKFPHGVLARSTTGHRSVHHSVPVRPSARVLSLR